MDDTVNDLLSSLRWMLNLPELATADEIKAELDKLFAMVAGTDQQSSDTATGTDQQSSNTTVSAKAKDKTIGLSGLFAAEKSKHSSVVAELNSKITSMSDELTQEKTRSAQFESELNTIKHSQRIEQVKGLFSDLNRDYTDEAAKVYLDMSDATFSAIATDMLSLKKTSLPGDLFKDTATSGKEDKAPSEAELTASLYKQVATRSK